jgi:hypothetical protein
LFRSTRGGPVGREHLERIFRRDLMAARPSNRTISPENRRV